MDPRAFAGSIATVEEPQEICARLALAARGFGCTACWLGVTPAAAAPPAPGAFYLASPQPWPRLHPRASTIDHDPVSGAGVADLPPAAALAVARVHPALHVSVAQPPAALAVVGFVGVAADHAQARRALPPLAAGAWRRWQALRIESAVPAPSAAAGHSAANGGAANGGVARPAAAGALSAREADALAWLARGESDEGVAHRMGVSVRTVRFHVENAKRRLGARTRAQAIARAVLAGHIRP